MWNFGGEEQLPRSTQAPPSWGSHSLDLQRQNGLDRQSEQRLLWVQRCIPARGRVLTRGGCLLTGEWPLCGPQLNTSWLFTRCLHPTHTLKGLYPHVRDHELASVCLWHYLQSTYTAGLVHIMLGEVGQRQASPLFPDICLSSPSGVGRGRDTTEQQLGCSASSTVPLIVGLHSL